MQRKEVVKQLAMSVLVPGLGLAFAIVFVVVIALLLDAFSSVLSWYSKPYLILPLYFAPTLIAFSLPPLLLNRIKSVSIYFSYYFLIICFIYTRVVHKVKKDSA